MDLSFSKISCNLNIALSTGHRTFSLFEQTGSVDPKGSQSGLDLILGLSVSAMQDVDGPGTW